MHIDSNTLKFYPEVLKESIVRFFDDDMPMHAAALSYYMVFSLPSMLLIVLWTSARFYDEVAVREAIFAKIGGLVGHQGAGQIKGCPLNNNPICLAFTYEPGVWPLSLEHHVLHQVSCPEMSALVLSRASPL